MAVSLPRDEDVELLPAWVGVAGDSGCERRRTRRSSRVTWSIEAHCSDCRAPRCAKYRLSCPSPPTRSRERATRGAFDGSLVVDLSALWSGPLCAHLLTLAGARVVKVESASRLDGARRGPPAFFDLLHAGQESVVLDLPTERDRLRHLSKLPTS